MLERPDLPDTTIIASLQANYAISVASLSFLPIGYDSSAWAYRVGTVDGESYFLKVRRTIANAAALVIPHALKEAGISQVVAPRPTSEGELWATAGEFALIVYPFIDGRTGTDVPLSPEHWTELGAMARKMHSMELSPELSRVVRRDKFKPEWSEMVAKVDAAISQANFADPLSQEMAQFWRERRQEILKLVDRARRLGKRLQASSPPLVLCHADMHTWNVMIDSNGRLWLVDWDETILAPIERDLMFVVGGIGAGLVEPEDEQSFLEGYGDASIDGLALAYYRFAWAVGDIGSFGEMVMLMPDAGEITRRDALRGLKSLFRPGDIISLAYTADDISLDGRLG